MSGFHKAVICLIRNLEVLSSKFGREPVILRGSVCSSSRSGWKLKCVRRTFKMPCLIPSDTQLLNTHRAFATRVSQLKIWHFWVIRIERTVRRCSFNRYSVITQFAKLAAGKQLCRRCTHRKLQQFKIFKPFSCKMTHFELWYCCRKWAICIYNYERNDLGAFFVLLPLDFKF